MRLFWLYFMALLAGFFTGCSQPTPQVQPPIVVDSKLVIDMIVEDFYMDNLTEIDQTLLLEYLDINPKHLEDFYGFVSLEDNYPDCAIYLKAKPDQTDKIAKDLAGHLSFLQDAYFHTENWQYLKLHYAEIFIYDQELYLIVGGREEKDTAEEAQKIQDFLKYSYAP